MYRLLRAGIRRYLHSKIFWICLLASLCLGVLEYFEMFRTDPSFETYRVIAGFLIFTILIAISIGKEFYNGGFRNKVIAGFTKGQIFFSEWLLAILSSVLFFVVISIPVVLMNLRYIDCFTSTDATKIIIGMLLVNISVAAISYFICMIISHRVIAPIISILLILCVFVLSNGISGRLDLPKHDFYYEYNQETGEMDEYLSKDINPRYIGEPLRTVLDIFTNAVPEGQIKEYLDILHEANRCSDYDYENEKFIPCKRSDEQIRVINTHPYYSLATILIFSFVGFIIFRKKGLN